MPESGTAAEYVVVRGVAPDDELIAVIAALEALRAADAAGAERPAVLVDAAAWRRPEFSGPDSWAGAGARWGS
jgi:hypothetical protein